MTTTIHPDNRSTGNTLVTIEVADNALAFRAIELDDRTPTGAQLAQAAGFRSAENVIILHMLGSGELEDIRPVETVSLGGGTHRFIIVASDRTYRVTLNGQRLEWPCRLISGGALRKLGAVPAEQAIFLERSDEPDQLIEDEQLVDLDGREVESFTSRRRTWQLMVQNVPLTFETPTVLVKTAIEKAGFDATQSWQIFLKVAGQPKRPVTLSDTVDMRTPGIEKLRLTPGHVDNGELAPKPRRDFPLLGPDHEHLDLLGLRWETVKEGEVRWLVIYDYPLPAGYTASRMKLALLIPPTYPQAQIYGFFTSPPLALTSKRGIPSTQMRAHLHGEEVHGWSRHRGPSAPWNPASDNVVTQLLLVDAALLKEVGD